jgi:hypothetical protein
MPANGIGAAANKTEVSTSDGLQQGYLTFLLIMLRKGA